MKINFTKSAEKDLNAIREFICENNTKAAREIILYIINEIQNILASNPGIGRAGRVLGTKEFILSRYPYIIPYLVKDDVLYILRVLHTSRKWPI